MQDTNIENQTIDYRKFLNKRFAHKLNDKEVEQYIEMVENMHQLIDELITIINNEGKEIFNDNSLKAFIIKLLNIQKYTDIDEWKYYLTDLILNLPNSKYTEVEVIEQLDSLFNNFTEES